MSREPLQDDASLQKRKNLLVAAGLTAMFTWGCLAYMELGKYAVKGTLFARVIDGKPYVNDFVSYYNAAVLGRRCLTERFDIYNIEVQNKSLNELISPVVPELPFYLQYPPYFFALVTPLSWLGIMPAWLFWNGSGLMLMYLSFRSLCKKDFPDRKRTLLMFALLLSSFPAWLSVHLGQASLFVFAGVAALLRCLEERQAIKAGIASGVAMIKFQYFPVLGLAGLLTGRMPFALSAAATLAALLALSIAALGLNNITNYPAKLLEGEAGAAVSGVSQHLMQNIRGQWFVMSSGSQMPMKLAAGALLLALFFIGWLWRMPGRELLGKEPQAFRVLSAVTLLVMLMTSPHTHSQDYLLIGIVAVMLLPWIESRRKHADGPRLRLMRNLLLAWVPCSWLLYFLMQLSMLTKVQPFFAWALSLAALSIIELRKAWLEKKDYPLQP